MMLKKTDDSLTKYEGYVECKVTYILVIVLGNWWEFCKNIAMLIEIMDTHLERRCASQFQ